MAQKEQSCQKQITQFSTMNALLGRLYEGGFPVHLIEAEGTIGLGCGDCMDGEMVMDDSTSYIGRIGSPFSRMDTNERVPFAQVAPFAADDSFTAAKLDKHALIEKVLRRVGSENYFIALRVTGTFTDMKLRLAPKADKPYPSLVELFAGQKEFSESSIRGTVIGFWAPEAYQGITVAGLHIHFMDEAKQTGGHVLDCTLAEGTVEYEVYQGFGIRLPERQDFAQADLNHEDGDSAIRHVEG